MVALANFRIEYLAPQMLDATARPDPMAVGYYRHQLVVTALKPKDALQHVIERGGVVVSWSEIKPKGILHRVFFSKVNRTYKQKFLQALDFNVRSGLSPEKALEQVILGELGEPRVALNEALNTLRQGFGFVQSLETLNWFDGSVIAVLRAGEATGQLSQAIATAMSLYSKSSKTLKLMFGAVAWTLIDIIMAVATVIGMRFGLIEQLKKAPLVSEDPAKVQAYQDYLSLAEQVNNGLLIFSFIFIVLMFYFGMMVLSNDVKIRRMAFSILEKIPVFNQLLICSGLSATTRVLASLLGGGVQFLTAVKIAQSGSISPLVGGFWADIIAKTEIGEHPSSSFNHVLLDSSERLLVRAHRDQQQLSECLSSISESREDRANVAAKKFAIIAFLSSLAYSGVAVLFSLAVVYLQNEAVVSGAG